MDVQDFIVVGAGMAGTSAAAELAAFGRVLLLERESQPAYHSTGRSAALFTETYGNRVVRALTTASRGHFRTPPAGFAEHPLLRPRGVLLVARPDQLERLEAASEELGGGPARVSRRSAAEIEAAVPALRRGRLAAALFDEEAADIEVHGLHGGYLRLLRARGGRLLTGAEVTAAVRQDGLWRVQAGGETHRGRVLVDAAGAWADELAALAGARPLGLVPKRRTALLLRPPVDGPIDGWPMVIDIDEQFYFKPDAGKLLASPADETPMPPCDVQPDELDIAILIDRLQAVLELPQPRIEHRWAGLRTFAADKTLVAGFDRDLEGFFWVAGQGGYGIQTAPAMARLTAALATGRALPADIADLGIAAADLSPARFA
ncbi:MAG: FAD-dependent oxidoreductase [Dongiaceae bacterium]